MKEENNKNMQLPQALSEWAYKKDTLLKDAAWLEIYTHPSVNTGLIQDFLHFGSLFLKVIVQFCIMSLNKECYFIFSQVDPRYVRIPILFRTSLVSDIKYLGFQSKLMHVYSSNICSCTCTYTIFLSIICMVSKFPVRIWKTS